MDAYTTDKILLRELVGTSYSDYGRIDRMKTNYDIIKLIGDDEVNLVQQRIQIGILETRKILVKLFIKSESLRLCSTDGIEIDVTEDIDSEEQQLSTSKQPKWERKETVLLVSEYFRTKKLPRSEQIKSIEFISNTLRKMAKNKDIHIDKKYRNITGIEMKFANIKSLDREYVAEGHSGLRNASILEKNIVDEYYESPEKTNEEAYFIIMKYLNI